MPPVYAATAPEWLQTVRTLPVGTELAFWQPTPAEPKQIAVGDRWYFKERGRPLIHGFGLFRGWEMGSLADLFQRYGPATGYRTADELARGIQALREEANLTTMVGNVILSGFNGFDPPRSLATLGLEDLNVRFRYIEGTDPLASAVATTQIGPQAAAEVPSSVGDVVDGPTTGVTPSDWTQFVEQSADVPAFVYALRFGTYNIWKVGWAVDVRKRLKLINDHIPHEVVKDQWKLVYAEPMTSKRRAYDIEQLVLKALEKCRTRGEQVKCSEKEFAAAWVSMLKSLRL